MKLDCRLPLLPEFLVDFSLFRIKVVRPAQGDMFTKDTPAPEILRRAILTKPTARSIRGFDWHIGNLDDISATGVHFALGRTTRATLPVLNDETGDFAEAEFESAPYTHVFVDIPLEVCAIAHKTSLAPTPNTIARQLEHVLNRSTVATEHAITFTVGEISEPDEFLRELDSAYAITSFTVYFTRPNPIDVEGDYLKPMERLTQETNGTSGSTTIKGEGLDSEPLKKLARSAAATGDNAKARLRPRKGAKPVQRSLKGATARLSQDSIESNDEKLGFFERIRAKYLQIRGTIGGDAA